MLHNNYITIAMISKLLIRHNIRFKIKRYQRSHICAIHRDYLHLCRRLQHSSLEEEMGRNNIQRKMLKPAK